MICRSLLVIVSCAVVFTQQTNAGYSLRWDAPTSVSTGAPISVDLYLDETAPDTNISNPAAGYGVGGASYTVTQSGTGLIGSADPNPSFDIASATVNAGTSADVIQSSFGGITSPTGSLKIGSFTINATSVGPGSLVLGLLNPGFLGDFTVKNPTLANDIVLDDFFFPSPTFAPSLLSPTFDYNFTAVPEPTSIGGVATIACLRIWRRRKRIVTADETNRWSLWRRSQRRRKMATTQKYSSKTGVWA